jgi:DNA invertase Pin-like site-specific DNA recombinase
MRTAAYIRVSTDDQAENGASLQAQEAATEQYCTAHGLEHVITFTDHQTAKTTARPGYEQLERALRSGEIQAVVVWRGDRLFRNTIESIQGAQDFARWGVELHDTQRGRIETQSAVEKLIYTVLSGVDQFERELTGERTKLALQHLKANGRKYGSIPYGFRELPNRGGKPGLEPDPTEQAVIARMGELRRQPQGYRRIAEALNAEGVPTKKHGQRHRRRKGRWAGKAADYSGKWTAATVRGILKREVVTDAENHQAASGQGPRAATAGESVTGGREDPAAN